jgi:hypothetical protein
MIRRYELVRPLAQRVPPRRPARRVRLGARHQGQVQRAVGGGIRRRREANWSPRPSISRPACSCRSGARFPRKTSRSIASSTSRAPPGSAAMSTTSTSMRPSRSSGLPARRRPIRPRLRRHPRRGHMEGAASPQFHDPHVPGERFPKDRDRRCRSRAHSRAQGQGLLHRDHRLQDAGVRAARRAEAIIASIAVQT